MLEVLLRDVSVPDFFARVFERDRLLIRGGGAEPAVRFTIQDVEELIYDSRSTANVHLMGAYADWPNRCFDDVVQAYRRGATVRLWQIGERIHAIRRLEHALEMAIGGTVSTNAYLTPGGNDGLAAHYDAHDVFVIQTEGSKEWKLYGWEKTLPTNEQADKRLEASTTQNPTETFVLETGDCLYIPRGIGHSARATHEPSLHLTIRLFPVLWRDLYEKAIALASSEAVALRRSVPMGEQLANEFDQRQVASIGALLKSLDTNLTFESVLEACRQDELARRQALPEGLLQQAARAADPVNPDDWLIKQPGQRALIERRGDAVSMAFFGGKPAWSGGFTPVTLTGDTTIEPLLRALDAQEGPFQLRALNSGLPEEQRLALVTRLLRGGYLAFALAPNSVAPPREATSVSPTA